MSLDCTYTLRISTSQLSQLTKRPPRDLAMKVLIVGVTHVRGLAEKPHDMSEDDAVCFDEVRQSSRYVSEYAVVPSAVSCFEGIILCFDET